jgi:hypothetical protein
VGNSINNIKFLGRKFFGIKNLSTSSYDADALAYFNANTAITSEADKTAINTFYLGLKSDGIYTKIKTMYLPLWSTATNNKWNLKDPRDLDAAFRLTFTTGWTHSSSGMTPNGTSAYSNSYLAPSTYYSTNIHLSYYSRTSTIGTVIEIGSTHLSGTNFYSFLATARNFVSGQSTNGTVTYLSQPNSLGFFVGNKLTNSSRKIFRNGSVNNTSVLTDANSLSNVNVYLGALNNSNIGGANFSSKQCSFASIGDGLSDIETTNFYTRVNTLMTYFGINV